MGFLKNIFGKKTEKTELPEESVPEKAAEEAETAPAETVTEEVPAVEEDAEELHGEGESVVSVSSDDGEYAVNIIRCGSEKVNLIKWIRFLTGCSLQEAKDTAEKGGMLGFVKGSRDALRWYYRFAQGDSSVEFRRNFHLMKPYGNFRIEVKDLNRGKRKFKNYEDNVGRMYAETVSDLLRDRGYAVRIVKNEVSGEEEIPVVLPNLFSSADFGLIGAMLKDTIGMTKEEYDQLQESDDGVLRGLDHDTAEYLRSILPLAVEAGKKEFAAARVLPKTEMRIWKMMTNRDEVYIPVESGTHSTPQPWLFPNEVPAILLEETDEEFLSVMDPFSAAGEISLKKVEKENLKSLLQELADRGQALIQVVHEKQSVYLNLDHYLKSPASQIEYNGRKIRRCITEFGSCFRKYDLMLPKRDRKTDRGDMLFCMAVNTKMNLMREVGLSVFYTIGDTTQKKDKITLYTQNAWNLIQKQTERDAEVRSFCAPDEYDTAVIPALTSYYNMVYKNGKSFIPLFTEHKGALEVKNRVFSEDPRANVVVVTFDDVKAAAASIDGLVIDLHTAGYIIPKEDFENVESMRKNVLPLPIALRFRNSGNPPKKKEPVFTIEDLQKIAGETQTQRVGCRTAKHDEVLGKWRLITQLDEKRFWFLSVFIKDDGKLEKYSLDYEGASDAHYEFTDEAGIRKKLYEAGDEYMYLDQIFARYVLKNGGEELLRVLYPFITAQFHYD